MNMLILMGNLTKDPEVNYTQSNVCYAKFALAVRGYQKDTTDFFNITAFGKSAEFAQNYLKKGTSILVQGHIVPNQYEKNGQKVYTVEIIADRMEFAGSSNHQGQAPQNGSQNAPNNGFQGGFGAMGGWPQGQPQNTSGQQANTMGQQPSAQGFGQPSGQMPPMPPLTSPTGGTAPANTAQPAGNSFFNGFTGFNPGDLPFN